MTRSEWDLAYGRACSLLNVSVFNADTDVTFFRNACIYGTSYNRGVSESFYDLAHDLDHPVKLAIFLRELNGAEIAAQQNSHIS